MKNELWLEFGVIQKEQNNWHEMTWYNEGRWQEFPYWLKDLLKTFFKRGIYHKIRFGKLRLCIH